MKQRELEEMGLNGVMELVQSSKEWRRFAKNAAKVDYEWNYNDGYSKEKEATENIVTKVLGVEKSRYTHNLALLILNDRFPWFPVR